MNDIMHEYLNKLRIIGKIRKDEKLDTTNGQLNVYRPGWFNWIYRKYYGDNKEEGTRYLQDFFKSLDQTVEQLVSEINLYTPKQGQVTTARYNKLINIAINLAEKIKQSIHGIENLSHTYAAYPRTTSTLEGIIQDFALPTYKQLIDIIPSARLTKVLKERFKYGSIKDIESIQETRSAEEIGSILEIRTTEEITKN